MPDNFLNTDIKFLAGIGPKKAKVFNEELEIFNYQDLLNYFPYKHIDRSKFYKISEITANSANIQLKGKITGMRVDGANFKQRLVATFADETGRIELIWFKSIKWISENLKKNKEYIVFGKPTVFGRKINIVHPELDLVEESKNKMKSPLQAVYSISDKMKKNFITSKLINKVQNIVIQKLNNEIADTLPASLIKDLKLISLENAYKEIHFPSNVNELQKAIFRLKFEELFFLQIQLLQSKVKRTRSFKGLVFKKVGNYLNDFYKHKIPFDLTNAQKRVIHEIRADLGSGKQMNRLLQGDVGSGKTLVALMVALIALDNDYQASIMAPTEILAKQHYESITELLNGLEVNVALLTGSSKTKYRKQLHEDLQSGKIQILIGTHALIEDTVVFKNLGLVIIDEQHRFGVAQRAKLWKKNVSPPHVLVMTATPIPRTLAMTVYGDLDTSIIDELPPGRKPIQTVHLFDNKRLKLFNFLRKEIDAGRQVYFVYPLIQESETLDYKDLEDGYAGIIQAFPPPKYTTVAVHGKMKAQEKDEAMQLFAEKKAQILVATTVIEVGVNVPNASVMVIESAEKFGLSQLHQLRGRVGRGSDQAWCVLMTSYKLSKEAKTRIQTMVNTSNGFEIAEADLKLRGPGDMEGTQQSGIAFDFKLVNLAQDGNILQLASQKANEIIQNDQKLENKENIPIRRKLLNMKKNKINWSVIS